MDKTTQTPPAHQKSWQRWVGLVARLILGVTLIVAGLLKVTAVDSSIAAVRTAAMLESTAVTFSSPATMSVTPRMSRATSPTQRCHDFWCAGGVCVVLSMTSS